jgi:hypothetical protein
MWVSFSAVTIDAKLSKPIQADSSKIVIKLKMKLDRKIYVVVSEIQSGTEESLKKHREGPPGELKIDFFLWHVILSLPVKC